MTDILVRIVDNSANIWSGISWIQIKTFYYCGNLLRNKARAEYAEVADRFTSQGWNI
jgi:hypothetical protein